MSKHMCKRGLVIAAEAKDATATCTGCEFTARWLGVGAESAAIESAKQHVEQTGHAARVTYERQVEYAPSALYRDHRLTAPTVQVVS